MKASHCRVRPAPWTDSTRQGVANVSFIEAVSVIKTSTRYLVIRPLLVGQGLTEGNPLYLEGAVLEELSLFNGSLNN